MIFRGIAGVLLAVTAFACLAQSFTVPINARQTYLRTSSDGGALNAVPINLSASGLAPGDTIRLTQLGDFNCHSNCGDISTGMIAVFSSSSTLLAPTNVIRVPGAIDAGVDILTATTFNFNLPTDIPQDFAVPAAGVTVTIPAGAQFLFVTAHDSLYGDNGDPNGDFAVKVELLPILANAGPDQAVNENVPVTLDGTASSGAGLAYRWEQLLGDPVVLDAPESAQPSFTAPELPGGFGMKVLTFRLTVTAGSQTSTDTIDVTVRNVNRPPTASADADQSVNEGSPVMLDGSASFDPDNDPLTYQWTQTAGAPVELTDATSPKPTFTAPLLPRGTSGSETLTFVLSVSDGALESIDMVQVVVEQVNHAPLANAGVDQTRDEGALVTLDGQASNDPDGDLIVAYAWTQVAGAAVTLSNADSATPTFTAPMTGAGGDILKFTLAVSDGLLASEDEVIVRVTNVNDPPLCSAAQATVARLWPPNHRMVEVGIAGVADPNNDRISISVTGVTQDEPVNGAGDGDASPDALIRGDKVLLRAERSGNGNGRVYQVSFTASDLEATCTGSVTVGVPHSAKPGGSAVDDGRRYDATLP